jgi:hypothetical protein
MLSTSSKWLLVQMDQVLDPQVIPLPSEKIAPGSMPKRIALEAIPRAVLVAPRQVMGRGKMNVFCSPSGAMSPSSELNDAFCSGCTVAESITECLIKLKHLQKQIRG